MVQKSRSPSTSLLLPCFVLLLLSRVAGHMARADQLQLTDQMIARQTTPAAAESLATYPETLSKSTIGNSASGSEAIDFKEDSVDLAVELHRSLRFEPLNLDFGTWSVGTAHSHTVTIVNQNQNRSVYLSSVSGRTPAFYSSFFESKVVPPQGNTTFSVVFLPRAHGAISTDLLIHTSFGQARLMVRGEGRECPYRLKPIVGVKAPLNATLMPEIHMYNPHEHPLQILEVYSSGGQFQLELPSGGQEGPQALWEIPPHTTKPVIRIRFHGNTAGNFTAYIRIKISEHPKYSFELSENVLVIPVEFEILPRYGIYSENPLVDFGRLTTQTKTPIKLKLHLRNSFEQSADYQLIRNDMLFPNISGLIFNPTDESIILDPQKFEATTKLDEFLLMRSTSKRNANEKSEFSLLVRAEVFKGALYYNPNTTLFVTKANDGYVPSEWRTLVVRNDFEMSLALLNVSVDQNETSIMQLRWADAYISSKASSLSAAGVILKPGQTLQLLRLRVLNDSTSFNTFLRIYTNVTRVDVPIVVCSGRLHISTQDSNRLMLNSTKYSNELNLGAIPLAEMSQDGVVILQNRNPLPIKLSTWDFQSPRGVYFHITYLGCLKTSVRKSLHSGNAIRIQSDNFELCSSLGENDLAVYLVAIQSHITDQNAVGTLKIWSTYETVTITVKFKTWMGKLEVDQEQLYFKKCFPGKHCFSDLSIRSTFQYPIHITSINFTDAGLRFEDLKPRITTIAAETVTRVGRIYFEPALLCQDRCYIPQEDKTATIAFPASSERKGSSNNNFRFDEMELQRRTNLFHQFKLHYQKIYFTLTSREVKQFHLQLIVDIEWPKLVIGKQNFPTIEIEKQQQFPIYITNPADRPILVDYFLADPKFAKETKLTLPREVVDNSLQSACYLTDKSVFSLPNGSPKKPLLVPARSNISLLVQFGAAAADNYCTLLHIRNNLTLYEGVWLSAKTVHSQFRLGNRRPGSTTPMLFELSEKHLAACRQTDNKYPLVLMKRTFTARNTGETPIRIDAFQVGEKSCESFGFKVIDCVSFELKANATKKIEISFSPDFTATRIEMPFKLQTNLSYEVSFLLVGQLPHTGLDHCLNLVPRPPWEERIRNAAIILLATTFVCVLIAAHIDYSNILVHQSAIYLSRDKGPVHPTFNLRNIAMKTQQQQTAEDTATGGGNSPQQRQQNNRSSVQNQKSATTISGSTSVTAVPTNNTNNIKKRTVKKLNSSGNSGVVNARNASSSSELEWSMELPTPASAKGKVSTSPKTTQTQTFSERHFKLRLEADKAAATAAAASRAATNSNVTPIESNFKATSPMLAKPATQNEKDAALPVNGSGGILNNAVVSGGRKQQRGPKKSKFVGNEKNEILKNGNKSSMKSSLIMLMDKVIPEVVEAAATTGKGVGELIKDSTDCPAVIPTTKDNTRKHSKTPGKERRKDAQPHHPHHNVNTMSFDVGNSTSTSASSSTSSNSSSSSSKRSERKQKNNNKTAVVNALNFNNFPTSTPPTTAASFDVGANNAMGVNCISSPWEVTFSEVLQLQQNSPVSAQDCSSLETSMHLSNLKNIKTDSEHSLLDIDLNRQHNFQRYNNNANKSTIAALDKAVAVAGTAATTGMADNNTPIDLLGPIGSKKSPSSTPVWSGESASTNLQIPKPTTISNNSSFFSNLMPSYTAYDNQQFRGMQQTGFYELKKTQEELQRQWQTNEYILNLQHQQLQAQQQLLQNIDSANNWTMSTPAATWSPMGYGAQVGVGANVAAPTSGGVDMSGISGSTWNNTAAVAGGGVGNGNNSGAVGVRPPPGLEINFQNANIATHMQQTQPQQQHQHQQQQQHQNQQHQVQASSANDRPTETNANEMQTFDPFSSLSSIWSDNWHKNPNSHNNNN